MHDLFSEIGPLKAALVHHDEKNRSLGTAYVVFKKPQDAAKAVEAYHLVPLDGRPLNVQMVAPILSNTGAAGAGQGGGGRGGGGGYGQRQGYQRGY
mmetsp:Transcript_12861/g.40435  ORF Transcript_12861/g.40435 Transcript_12861/m.40435 type:complete len:96 (+) Transcript_12861:292-579(+)